MVLYRLMILAILARRNHCRSVDLKSIQCATHYREEKEARDGNLITSATLICIKLGLSIIYLTRVAEMTDLMGLP